MTNAEWTANQLVAYNLARARHLRGWTQTQAAIELEKHLGKRWSKATWSAAERSLDGVRVHRFDVDELVALSRTFSLPTAWWFLPPGDFLRAEGILRRAQMRLREIAGGLA